MIAIGLEIGGTNLRAVAMDAAGAVRDRAATSVERGSDAARIRAGVVQLLELIDVGRADCVGVGFGGPVDWRTGVIARSHQVAGWDGFDLAGWLHEVCDGAAVFVENDTNAAAYAEATLGAGRGAEVVVYSNSGSGIGGGLVVRGELYRGAPPGEMEIGHLRLGDGSQTTEDLCSGWAIDRRVRDFAAAHPDSALAAAAKSCAGCEARALAIDDDDAQRLLDDAAGDYALALSHAVHLLSPNVIVLGGGVAQLGERWRAAVETCLRGFTMAAMRGQASVKLSELGDVVVPIGAGALAIARSA